MTTRRRWQLSILAAVAVVVAACGGGQTDSPLASRVIAFGDSLTDVGTYVVATSINGPGTGAPFFGGKFTTNTFTGYTAASNTSTSNIWVEWIAARLGVVITQAEVGFATTRIPCPAAASGLAGTCTGYAQGGARVTDPNGIGRAGGAAALTIPVVDQIASHNTRVVPGFRTGFNGDDVVFVWAGHNDALTQVGLLQASATTPQAAVAAMATAGTELAALINNEIVAKGASKVAWLNAVDLSLTPAFAAADAGTKGLVTQLTATFNDAVEAGIAGSGVKKVDVRAYLQSVIDSNGAVAGLTNVTDKVCDQAKIQAITGNQVTNGSSLFCNASPASAFPAPLPSLNTQVTGTSASTYLFADDVHPTSGGHKATADFVWGKLKDFGWVPANL